MDLERRWCEGCNTFDWNCDCHEIWPKQLETLGHNLEMAASMAALHRVGYFKGFSDAKLLESFCEDYIPEPYFPMGDSRPTAERLGWVKSLA